MQDDRFTPKGLQFKGVTNEEAINRIEQCLRDLFQQINNAGIPVVIGPNDKLPEGLYPGQPVIDWRSGTSSMKVWDGNQLI